ncbi:MAG: ribosome-binding factor A [Candidatus Spechtbacteria bacterium RIFCSPHIGHO2_02_FULL_43_15b]|nr:MAG: ribosome-binding factor A [Candidatus Spechtbacteria bacterium RIFCSPHIGHO2_02_FULL_43_15b]
MSRRLEQVNELILKELNTIILKELETPGVLLTLTRVMVSKDLGYADVYFATIPDEASPSAKQKLDKNRGVFQKILNKRLRMRPLPMIRFRVDEEEREAAKLDELLSNL